MKVMQIKTMRYQIQKSSGVVSPDYLAYKGLRLQSRYFDFTRVPIIPRTDKKWFTVSKLFIQTIWFMLNTCFLSKSLRLW